jgi:glycosyltransferase involved in cell wall biosynthesis
LALITSQAFSISNFRAELVAAWQRAGIRVFALAPDYDDETRRAVRALGAEPVDFRLSRVGLNPLGDLGAVLSLTRILGRLRVDACFCYFIKPVIYGNWAGRLAGVGARFSMIEGGGYVFDTSVPMPPGRHLLKILVSFLYWTSLRGARHVFFLNQDDYRFFVPRLASPESASVIGGIGVDLRKFSQAPLPEGIPVFLLGGRLLAEKGVREFVAAARQLRGRARFILLGGPDLNPGSISRAELTRWSAEGLVEWIDHVPDVRPVLRRASVFVLPSYYREGVPRGIQEAMAMGRPIITTDMPGCRDTVEHGRNGLLVPPRDVAALVGAMSILIDDPARIEVMGATSRRLAETRFDVLRVNARIMTGMGLPQTPTAISASEVTDAT